MSQTLLIIGEIVSVSTKAKVREGWLTQDLSHALPSASTAQISNEKRFRNQSSFPLAHVSYTITAWLNMAWYEVFVLWVLWCWERIRPFDRTRRDGRNEDDLTSLTDRMPVFEDKIINTSVRFVNGEITAYVVQTEYLDTQDVCSARDSYWNNAADIEWGDFCSNSISDQSTIVEENEVKALEGPELFAVRPSYIGTTGKRTVDFFYK
ncbi:hypothetical protein KXV98_004333, partial [Aspergillus fumigatus]